MSFIHKSFTPWSMGMVFSCGLAISACGAAPDGTDTTDTVSSALCHGDNCPEPPTNPNPGPAPQLNTFRLRVQGIEIWGNCESGWEGDAAEAYWTIDANYGQVPMSSRSSDDYVTVGWHPVTGFPGWIPMNVTKDIMRPLNATLQVHASAWDADDFLGGGDDWLGNVVREVSPNELTRGVNREFGDFSNGGGEYCRFQFWYDITML